MSRYAVVLLLCATLGLAPFLPEPHLLGKLRWVAGGAVGMQAMDWLDLLFHGAPWLALLGMMIWDAARLARNGLISRPESSGETD